MRDCIGNLEPTLDVYPDRPGPVVRNTPEGREMAMLTWGMPTPPFITKGKPDSGVTNIRKVGSPHWRRWLKPENRCVVPWTAFCEWEQTTPKRKRWFARSEDKPLAFFAGVWTNWTGERGPMKSPRPGEHELYGFLTTEPNGIVEPIHQKAMPLILTTEEEIETWMTAPWEDAKRCSVRFEMISSCCCRHETGGHQRCADRRIAGDRHSSDRADDCKGGRWAGWW